MGDLVVDPTAVKAAVQPFLDHDLVSWKGLPRTTVETLNAAIGEPTTIEQAVALGRYAADRHTHAVKSAAGGLAAYVRNGEVVLIEGLVSPPLSAMEGLGEPTAILPHEILLSGTYVHEYLYPERGLVLSIAQPFQKAEPLKIVRFRGVRPLDSADEFGPEFYQAFEDQTVW